MLALLYDTMAVFLVFLLVTSKYFSVGVLSVSSPILEEVGKNIKVAFAGT